jgi:hypothetical protein
MNRLKTFRFKGGLYIVSNIAGILAIERDMLLDLYDYYNGLKDRDIAARYMYRAAELTYEINGGEFSLMEADIIINQQYN